MPSCSLLSRFRNRCSLLLLALSAAFAVHAHEIYRYQGADRAQRLVSQAKKEGTLSLYSAMTLEDAQRAIATDWFAIYQAHH